LSDLPYRLNVGAALFNAAGHVFVGRRADLPAGMDHVWQMPQGGIDPGENPRTAIFRELEEEIGTAKADILAEHPDWLSYDLPAHLVGQAFGGKYRGQKQKWFALRFTGSDSDINLNAHTHPEFIQWRWAPLNDLPNLAVPFKRDIYTTLTHAFAAFGAAGVGTAG
jgi:putative (di)nucleoside polyphosphate hydrolase